MNKRVLYVDKSPRDEWTASMTNGVLLELRKKYDVEIQNDLSTGTVWLLNKEAKENRAYDALLTHFPFNRELRLGSPELAGLSPRAFYEKLYGGSRSVLKSIKEYHPKMPIVLYTGADNHAEMDRLLREVTDSIVSKTGEPLEDAMKIGMALERLLV